MTLFSGYIITIICCLGGYAASGGHLATLAQPYEVIIIVGAVVGSFVAGNNMRNVKLVLAAFPLAFKNPAASKQKNLDLLCLLFEILNKIRKDGMMALEADIEEPEKSAMFTKYPEVEHDHHLVEFITDYLRMMLGGAMNLIQLEALMETELDVHHQEAHYPATAIQKMADGLPAFGIVAAVMGVVHTMESVGLPPAELGKLIAAALVGTFLGILLSYGFVGPISAALEQKGDLESKAFLATKTVLLAHLNGFTPQAAVEFGRKILFSDQRPSFRELDEAMKAVKGK